MTLDPQQEREAYRLAAELGLDVQNLIAVCEDALRRHHNAGRAVRARDFVSGFVEGVVAIASAVQRGNPNGGT